MTKISPEKTLSMTVSSLSQYDSGAIYQLLKFGFSYRQIALRLGCCKATVCNELKRVNPYNPIKAQHDADINRHRCGRHYALNTVEQEKIEDDLRLTWSPEEVAHKLHICTKSIYNWIYHGVINFSIGLLPDKNKRHKRKHERRGHIHILHQIKDRPKIINTRHTFGNWEVDTVLSSRGESKSCLATFVERRTRFTWLIKIPNRTSKSMAIAMKKFLHYFRPTVKTITTDNGREFSHNDRLEHKYHIPFYFCDPYSPWERGTNERMNKRIRWFFPNKTNFEYVSNKQVIEAIDLINNRPLKVLHWKSTVQAFHHDFIHRLD